VVTIDRQLDHSQESKDNQALLEFEKSMNWLTDPDEPEMPNTLDASDFQGVTLTEEQENALQEFDDQRDAVDSAYNDLQSATDDLRNAYREVIKAFGFIPVH
jgi:hypothetical protein